MTVTPWPPRPGRNAPARRKAEILRVDHAGELGAVHIYRGQRAVMEAGGREPISGQLERMEAQEARHLARFETLLCQEAARPTLLAPLWRGAGFALGVGTALMGEKAAHACAELSGFRDEEIAHRDEAVESGAREAPGYRLLSSFIRAGCRLAIRISERI